MLCNKNCLKPNFYCVLEVAVNHKYKEEIHNVFIAKNTYAISIMLFLVVVKNIQLKNAFWMFFYSFSLHLTFFEFRTPI